MEDNKNEFSATEQTEEFIPEKKDYEAELLEIIRSNKKHEEIKDLIANYHDNDIADVIPKLTPQERKRLYRILGNDAVSDVFAYLDDVEDYIAELDNEKAADIIESMDADDALEVLEELPKEQKEQIFNLLDSDAKEDIKLIDSYDDDMIGSRMTTNFVAIKRTFTVKQAMRSLISQAAENDNITAIYVVNDDESFYGVIELRELIIARDSTPLEDIISTNYPYVYDKEKIGDCIIDLRDYNEDSIPVLDAHNKLIGVITASEIVETVGEEMGDDYAKFAGLTSAEDTDEPLRKSIKKRLPWLLILLALGLLVATVIKGFQSLIPVSLIILYTFQSLILDMSGNTGTQSLAVTIRVLSEENLAPKEKFKFILKELRVGFTNGLLVGFLAFIVIGCYVQFFEGSFVKTFGVSGFSVAGCISLSLLMAMIAASLDGTLIPIAFKKIGIDPAVASGPLITTLNDLIAVCTYYGVSLLLLVKVLGLS